MSSCAGCGACCAAITYRNTKTKMREWLAYWKSGGTDGADGSNPEDYAFITRHWTRISRAEAMRRRPSLGDHPRFKGMRYWVCDQFDYQTRRCMAYDSRPPICQGFPWYGAKPSVDALTALPECSYWHDIPRADWPKGTIPLRPVQADAAS